MDRTAVWNDLIERLVEAEFETHKQTKEYEYWKNRLLHIDEMLTTNLTRDERQMVDEVIYEISEVHEHDGKRLYQQGMKDCVIILKNVGVL